MKSSQVFTTSLLLSLLSLNCFSDTTQEQNQVEVASQTSVSSLPSTTKTSLEASFEHFSYREGTSRKSNDRSERLHTNGIKVGPKFELALGESFATATKPFVSFQKDSSNFSSRNGWVRKNEFESTSLGVNQSFTFKNSTPFLPFVVVGAGHGWVKEKYSFSDDGYSITRKSKKLFTEVGFGSQVALSNSWQINLEMTRRWFSPKKFNLSDSSGNTGVGQRVGPNYDSTNYGLGVSYNF